MEKIDAALGHHMFGDDDMNFDLQLEKFGNNTGTLKVREVQQVFWAWVEDWEKEARKKKTVCVRRNGLQSIKILCSVIQILLKHIIFMKTVWSSEGGEDMDGW
jgi:hypothetical protein